MWRRACPASACGSRALQQDVHPAHHDPADLRRNMMKMKMAVVSEISLLLLFCCFFIFPTESLANCNRYAAKGEAFVVPLEYNLTDTDVRVKWRRGFDVIVDRKSGPPGKKYTFSKGGDNDIYPNGSLRLMNVDISDAKEYIPNVFSADGKSVPNLKSTHLCVLDRVTQPTLDIACLETQLILTCQVAQGEDLHFSWLQNNVQLKINRPKLVLDLKSLERIRHSFSCKVYNQVSVLTSQTVSSDCNKSFFSDIWIIIYISVGGGGGLVIILTIIVIVCCVRAKRKKRMQKTDEEELRLRWANPEQPQQHECPQHGHPTSHQRQHQHQQQPAGHTGPRQHRSKQHREQQHRPRAQESAPPPPQPGPRRATQTTKAEVIGDDEKPPPLPQPRTKTPRTRQV